MKFNIEQFLSLDEYVTEERSERRKTQNNKNGKSSSEFFTPYCIVKQMTDKISPDILKDPTKTFIESSFGNGQFLIMILYKRIIEYNINWKTALETLYGIELIESNVKESRQRVHELLRNISPDYDPKVADEIMDKNFVCHDFFTWDFENWREMTKEELKKKTKKKKDKKIPGQLEIEFE